jgi:hypothetical protein
VPSSQAPHLFWEPSNLTAACRRCNYGDGSPIAAANTRQTIEQLRALVEQLRYENDGLECARKTAGARDPLATTTARILEHAQAGDPASCAR